MSGPGPPEDRYLDDDWDIDSGGPLSDIEPAKLSTRVLSEADIAHRRACDKHDDAVAERYCNALTVQRVKCKRKAKDPLDDDDIYFPTCAQHKYSSMHPFERCQATEECGQLCLRLSTPAEPFHLCSKHSKGTSTLPCYLLKLPTELRLMIFRYLIPTKVAARYSRTNLYAKVPLYPQVLRINRQLYEEAAHVLYQEAIFQVEISSHSIAILGKAWHSSSGSFYSEKSRQFPSEAVNHIRKLRIQINLNESSYFITQLLAKDNVSRLPTSLRMITEEDFSLFSTRDHVIQFVELFTSESQCKELSIQPEVYRHTAWDMKQMVGAVQFACEPFRQAEYLPKGTLCAAGDQKASCRTKPRPHRILIGEGEGDPKSTQDEKYKSLQRKWKNSIPLPKLPSPASASLRAWHFFEQRKLARIELRSIQSFAQTVYHLESSTNRAGRSDLSAPWTSTVFQSLHRVLHIARVAAEEVDLPTLSTIKKQIIEKWDEYHRQLHSIASGISKEIERMSGRSLGMEYPTAFGHEISVPVARKLIWPEMVITDGKPQREDAVVFDDRSREYLWLAGTKRVWVQHKTPRMIREARSRAAREKANSD